MKKSSILTMALAGLLLASAGVSHAMLVVDFESPTYTTNTDISGVDSWTKYGSAGGGLVTPGTTGYPALSGSQSFVASGSGRFYVRPFTTPLVLTNDAQISWLFWQEGNASVGNPGNNTVYLGNSVASATPIAGIGGATNDVFKLVGTGADTITSVSLVRQKTYRLTMVLDFDNQQFEAYAENLTDSGPFTYLGTKGFALALAAGPTTATTPVLGFTKTSGSAIVIDDFEVIPEPSAVALLGVAGMLCWRKRK